MQATSIRIFLVLFLLMLIDPLSVTEATEQRIALVIGNGDYSSGPLKNPVNDASDMAVMLKKLGFSVTLKKNAKQQEMDESIREFGSQLKKTRGVGLFYYAGHGIQIGGVNYLLPVNARIEKESDVRFQSVNADIVLAEMENAENGLNIVILDACRDNPFSRSFRNSARGLAIISSAPSGTFISYSTGGNQIARDGDGRNSPYTKALLENMDKPGLSISNMFMNVRSKVKKETGQVPWELSSLEEDFFFLPGSAKTLIDKSESVVSKTPAADDLEDENKKLEAEQRRIEEEKSALTKRKSLDEKKRQVEEERESLEAVKEAQRLAETKRKTAKKISTLAMAKRPSSGKTARDGHFIAYNNGTVSDTRTGLMWAAKDNGSDIDWPNAKSYCENYRGGGYSDWRMPTQVELGGLFDLNAKSRLAACDKRTSLSIATELIDITCYALWTSVTRGSEAAFRNFFDGNLTWRSQSYDGSPRRVLPVRSAK